MTDSSKVVYVFRDHWKKSSDPFRNVIGLFHDLNNGQVKSTQFPKNTLLRGAEWKFGTPEISNAESLVFRQKVKFLPTNTEENRQLLQSLVTAQGGPVNIHTLLDFGIPNGAPPVTLETFLKLVLKDGGKLYRDINLKTIKTAISTTEDSELSNWSRTESNYNFYVEKYENHIKNPQIPEEVLPNFYVFSLALDRSTLDTISQKDFDNSQGNGLHSPYDNFMSKFDTFITMDNNVLINLQGRALLAPLVVDYLNQYADTYDNVSINFIETMKKRFGFMFANINSQEFVNKLNQFKSAYPMYIDVFFTTPIGGAFLDFLTAANLSVESFTSFINEKLLVEVNKVYEPGGYALFSAIEPFDIVETFPGGTIEKKVLLFLHDIETLIRSYIRELIEGNADIQRNITLNSRGGATFIGDDQLDTSMSLEHLLSSLTAVPKFNELMNRGIRSYKDIVLGDFAKSEILYYRIEKKDINGKVLQNFCLPNIPGVSVQNFVDTQIKYDKEYIYKIYAGTAVYGTEYYYAASEPETLLLPIENQKESPEEPQVRAGHGYVTSN